MTGSYERGAEVRDCLRHRGHSSNITACYSTGIRSSLWLFSLPLLNNSLGVVTIRAQYQEEKARVFTKKRVVTMLTRIQHKY